jgi:hypothetical protein
MIAAISPYHLTTREPPAMAALLLSRRVFTILPTPAEGQSRRAVENAVARSPRYLRFMESWRWSVPLWNAGVVGAALDGDTGLEDIREVCSKITADERLTPLRPFMKLGVLESDEYLDAVTHDLLRGGPDPAVSVPLAAGLDRFASRHGLLVARANPTSVAQRAEMLHARPLGAVGLPILLQAGGERMEWTRDKLAPSLADLRDAIEETVDSIDDPVALKDGSMAVSGAARDYAKAFDALRPELRADAADDEIRVVDGAATLTLVEFPADVVLRSSAAAAAAMLPTRAGRAAGPASATATSLPVKFDPLDSASIVSMLVKVVGAKR